MATGNSFKTDLYHIYNYIENSFISYPKELMIETLREIFAQDSYFHYVKDTWGYPKVTDHTNQLPVAGIDDDSSTRIFIGEAHRHDSVYYPAIIVKNAGVRSVPISFNRNKYCIQWENTIFEDGYGNRKIIKEPSYYHQDGAWEGTLQVDIKTKNAPSSRDEITQLVAIICADTRFDELKDSGLVIKSTSVGSASETDDRTDKIYQHSINFEYRYEWHRLIPIKSTIDVIKVCFDIGTEGKYSPNLSIQYQLPTN